MLHRPKLIASVIVVAALAQVLAPPRASAQSSHIEASVRAGQARRALRDNDLEEAVRLFRESVGIYATYNVYRELAQTLERLGRRREAAGAWTMFATLAPRQDDRDAGITRREYLRHTPGLLRVRVTPVRAARSAQVWIDRDAPRYVPVGGAESTVEGGTHRVRVESPGYLPFEMMVPTAFGEPVGVVALMRPDPRAVQDAGAP